MNVLLAHHAVGGGDDGRVREVQTRELHLSTGHLYSRLVL